MTATITEEVAAHRAIWEHQPKPCSIDDCDRKTMARSMCSLHYHRWKKHGDPLYDAWAESATWLENAVWLIDQGESVGGVCQSLHMRAGSIARQLSRLGRKDLAAPFWRAA